MTNEQVILYLKEFVTEQRFALFNSVLDSRVNYISVLLENVFQSHNASAVIRTCEALGLQDLYVYERYNLFKPNEEISMGADKWLTFHHYRETDSPVSEMFNEIHQKGYKIVATTLHEKSVSLYDLPLDKSKLLFLFGTEKEGLSKEMIQHADAYVKIPMFGFTESFNVSVSVGITLHYILNKLRNSSISISLSNKEKEELLIKWLTTTIPSGDKILKQFISKGNK